MICSGACRAILAPVPRFLIRWLLGLGGSAVALAVSAVVFDGFAINADGWLTAFLIFGVLSAILPFLVAKALLRTAGSIIALSGLIATFLALALTDLLSRGLTVTGVETWLGSTLLIWVLSMFIWLLPGPWRSFRKGERSTA